MASQHEDRVRGATCKETISVLPDTSVPFVLVVVLRANLPASELEAFVEAVDSLVITLALQDDDAKGSTYVQSAHHRFELDVHDAVLVVLVELDLLDWAELVEN
jgi:hypothetical protein